MNGGGSVGGMGISAASAWPAACNDNGKDSSAYRMTAWIMISPLK
jgi:hypothetical protein